MPKEVHGNWSIKWNGIDLRIHEAKKPKVIHEDNDKKD
jgi:hypothetical protein